MKVEIKKLSNDETLKEMNVNATFIAPRINECVKCEGDKNLYKVVSIVHIYGKDDIVMIIWVA
jgi:hypothetical protein